MDEQSYDLGHLRERNWPAIRRSATGFHSCWQVVLTSPFPQATLEKIGVALSEQLTVNVRRKTACEDEFFRVDVEREGAKALAVTITTFGNNLNEEYWEELALLFPILEELLSPIAKIQGSAREVWIPLFRSD